MSIRIALAAPAIPLRGNRPAGLARVKPKEPAGEAVAAALRLAAARLQEIAPSARDGEVRGVHKVRVLCRRLRSELRAFRDLVERDWRERLEAELKWLGNALGDVRDLDVLKQHLQAAAAGAEEEDRVDLTEPLQPLFAWLDQRREGATKAMRQALASERFARLTAALQEAIDAPPLRKRARKPCRRVLPPLADATWRRLRKDARALGRRSPDERFHDVRKRAKRARYTAECVAPTLKRSAEKRAKVFIRSIKSVQDVLGEHQDMTIAVTEVRDFLTRHPHDPELARAGDALLGRLHRSADAARVAFLELWPKLDRPKRPRWMKASKS